MQKEQIYSKYTFSNDMQLLKLCVHLSCIDGLGDEYQTTLIHTINV